MLQTVTWSTSCVHKGTQIAWIRSSQDAFSWHVPPYDPLGKYLSAAGVRNVREAKRFRDKLSFPKRIMALWTLLEDPCGSSILHMHRESSVHETCTRAFLQTRCLS